MRIPEKTAHEPFFVARRLRRVTMASVRRSDELSHAYIAQAADLISEQAKKIAQLSLVVANYQRERPIGERRNSPHGKVVRGKTTTELAKRLRGEITGLCDLYRAPNGAVRIVRPDAVASGELVGRFDGTATWQQIAEALE